MLGKKQLYLRALAIDKERTPQNHYNAVNTLRCLSLVRFEEKNFIEASRYLIEALDLFEKNQLEGEKWIDAFRLDFKAIYEAESTPEKISAIEVRLRALQ